MKVIWYLLVNVGKKGKEEAVWFCLSWSYLVGRVLLHWDQTFYFHPFLKVTGVVDKVKKFTCFGLEPKHHHQGFTFQD